MGQHFDVLVVGAGISGVSAAYHLQEHCPDKSFAVLDNQESFGGTWLTHKYPGIRSDSDLFTFGYKFKPWTGAPIATAEEILKYMNETIEEFGIADHIRYSHKIKKAHWSSEENLWTLQAEKTDTGETIEFTCNFLWMCQGYYRHSEGYTPEWEGMDEFKGDIIHPQTWPEDLDYKDKNVLVIGSGATAATIIPAMAADCKHITMLQRSPTYFIPGENRNEMADLLADLDVPEEWKHEVVRQKILNDQKIVAQIAFDQPEFAKEELVKGAKALLPEGYDVETHFTPHYKPWRQRIAFVPDGDLFKGVSAGKASIVTDHIDRYTEKGILLKSGEELEADIIVTATGFNLAVLGDIEFSIDDAPLNFPDRWAYRGMMFSDIPNMVWVFGYLRTSWTMRADMISEFVSKLLNHMDELGAKTCTPQLRDEDKQMPALPFIDPENFNPGYLQRSIHTMPKQGDHEPWTFHQDYYREKEEIPNADLDDGTLVYGK